MIASYLASKAIEYEIIKQEYRELYEMAFSTLFFSIITWSTLLVLGAIQKCIWGCIAFIIAYLPLRVFSGGFHLETKIKCYCFSIVVFIVFLTIYSYELYTRKIYFFCLLFALPIIFTMAPQENKNKPLCKNEYVRNRRAVLFILVVEVSILIGLYFAKKISAFFFVSYAPILMASLLIIGKIKNKFRSI